MVSGAETEAGAGTQRRRHKLNPLRAAANQFESFNEFETLGSWATYFRHKLARRWGAAMGAGKVVGYRPKGVRRPVAARLGTVDFIIGHHMFVMREYGKATEMKLRSSPVIVDLGTNVGMSVRVWLERWPDARIVTVEPDADNLAVAAESFKMGGVTDRVTLLHGACVGEARRVVLKREGLNASEFEIDPEGDSSGDGAVDGLTVPMICEKAGIADDERIDFLKCDIEGAEEEVFGGCADWIGRVENILIEVHHEYTQERLEADLAAAGWRASRTSMLLDFDGGRVLLLER